MSRPDNSSLVVDATEPPHGRSEGVLCPRCRVIEAEPEGFKLRRCEEHQLTLVRAKDFAQSGEDALLGTTFAERFVVLAKLGSGAMGAVYRARQEAFGRDVALKIVRPDKAYDPDTRARFEREARAMSSLTSPHTVTAFDFGAAEDGAWYLAMELLDGETLGARLKRGPMGVSEALSFIEQALESLSEAHHKGIIHRDLKPDNLFLAQVPEGRRSQPSAPDEVCKVLDFGIAKLLRDELNVDQLETQAGTVFGTPRYMSPEQAQGKALDARSDLYSLGVILYHALAGRAPFVDDDAVVVMAKHIKVEPEPLSSLIEPGRISRSLEAVVERALAKDPARRFQSADEFSSAIQEARLSQASLSGSHSTSWVANSAPAHPLRRAYWLGAGLLAAVFLLGALFVFSSKGNTAVDATLKPEDSSLKEAAAAQPGGGLAAGATISPHEPVIEPEQAPPDTALSDAEPDASSAPSASASASAKPPNFKRYFPKVSAPASSGVKLKPGDRYGRFE